MDRDNNSPLTPYAKRVQHGMALANRNMMYRASAFGYALVIGRHDGTWYNKDAATLMAELRESQWWTDHFDD